VTHANVLERARSLLRPAWHRWRRSLPAAVLMGIRLGRLSPAAVQARTDRYYSSAVRGSGIDYRSEAHNLRGPAAWERDAVASHFPPAGRVLVYGAGGGREIVTLARLGYAGEGCECHPGLVASARALFTKHQLDAVIHHTAAGAPPPGTRTFDAVLIGWSAYAHIQGRDARVALLRALAGRAAARAPIILSFHVRAGVRFPYAAVSRAGNAMRHLVPGPAIETGDTFGRFFLHMFTRDEVTAELRDGGWEMVEYGESGTGWAVAVRS
jgi:hypothetical protein